MITNNVILTTNVNEFIELGFRMNRENPISTSFGYFNFELNKVYYMETEGKLTAFKVLAISFISEEYLVQFPTEIKILTTRDFSYKKFFTSKEQYFSYVEGQTTSHIVNWKLLRMRDLHEYFKYSRTDTKVILKNAYKWVNSESKPYKTESFVRFIVLTEKGLYVSFNYIEDTFPTYQECVKNHINGMKVEDFEEETFSINLVITKEHKPRIFTLNFIENL